MPDNGNRSVCGALWSGGAPQLPCSSHGSTTSGVPSCRSGAAGPGVVHADLVDLVQRPARIGSERFECVIGERRCRAIIRGEPVGECCPRAARACRCGRAGQRVPGDRCTSPTANGIRVSNTLVLRYGALPGDSPGCVRRRSRGHGRERSPQCNGVIRGPRECQTVRFRRPVMRSVEGCVRIACAHPVRATADSPGPGRTAISLSANNLRLRFRRRSQVRNLRLDVLQLLFGAHRVCRITLTRLRYRP